MLCIFFFMAGLYFVIQDNPPAMFWQEFCLGFHFSQNKAQPPLFSDLCILFFVNRKQALVFILYLDYSLGRYAGSDV